MRLFKVPKLTKYIFTKRVWGFSLSSNTIFLSFDDGPNPEITPFVLDELKKRNLKATFFCVGANVERFPDIFSRIKNDGHAIGNHTFYHENANKVDEDLYLSSIEKANKLIESKLFRPPYGRLSSKMAHKISKKYRIIMWTWLSYDFDNQLEVEQILLKANQQIKKGDILVLHDNPKIKEKQQVLLPKLLDLLVHKGFLFETIPE